VTCEQLKLVYDIDLDRDLIESITFLTEDGRVGELMFSYLQEIDQAGNEFVAPARTTSRGPQQSPPGMTWLVQLAKQELTRG
jgi:hypothetical protein